MALVERSPSNRSRCCHPSAPGCSVIFLTSHGAKFTTPKYPKLCASIHIVRCVAGISQRFSSAPHAHDTTLPITYFEPGTLLSSHEKARYTRVHTAPVVPRKAISQTLFGIL